MFNKVHPFYHGALLAIVFGLTLSAIINRRQVKIEDIEIPRTECKDTIITLSTSNHCSKGTFLELANDTNGKHYIICHCEQPINVIIQTPPVGQEQEEQGEELLDPDVITPRRSITL